MYDERGINRVACPQDLLVLSRKGEGEVEVEVEVECEEEIKKYKVIKEIKENQGARK